MPTSTPDAEDADDADDADDGYLVSTWWPMPTMDAIDEGPDTSPRCPRQSIGHKSPEDGQWQASDLDQLSL
jgi:hypothetical protein